MANERLLGGPTLDARATTIAPARHAPLLATRWQVRLLGSLELRCCDLVVTRRRNRSVNALLARLALRPASATRASSSPS